MSNLHKKLNVALSFALGNLALLMFFQILWNGEARLYAKRGVVPDWEWFETSMMYWMPMLLLNAYVFLWWFVENRVLRQEEA